MSMTSAGAMLTRLVLGSTSTRAIHDIHTRFLRPMRQLRRSHGRMAALPAFILTVALGGCAGAPSEPPASPDGSVSGPTSAGQADTPPLEARLVAIDAAVDRWRSAADLASARRAAEEARNLVVGPAGPGYGDTDGDGTVEGATDIGLLPGLGGQPGLATGDAGACVGRDVLGGSWADPARRWSIMQAAIDAWSQTNNTFPSLPSHPQRIVGWATLALAAPDLATALEYGGHAHLHIDVALGAVTACGS
jgi:hypothetical protein